MAIRRLYRLIPAWLKVVLSGAIVIALGWQAFFPSSVSGSLAGYNHTDRPIFSYWVNGNWGGDGGTTCCWSFKDDTAEVVWILSMTSEQERAGMEAERHSATLPMPEHSRGDQYLHVHFLPGNKVDLVWSENIRSPKLEYYRREYGR
ncbi:DUF3304 domain-containing protein [Billgrantia tianxiuensis]|uniref:DUF3304 domain-containing protein n=2 Tax=Oceanospirillales TaxID=135619 RepID=A0A6I6SWX7_9GAMM|nr:DUF3304 domain-containing protein [Halomonas sp. MCCC 1A11057]QHC52113.1 DUF3304 domain-containing protein [Halomonas tianxiuensis]